MINVIEIKPEHIELIEKFTHIENFGQCGNTYWLYEFPSIGDITLRFAPVNFINPKIVEMWCIDFSDPREDDGYSMYFSKYIDYDPETFEDRFFKELKKALNVASGIISGEISQLNEADRIAKMAIQNLPLKYQIDGRILE